MPESIDHKKCEEKAEIFESLFRNIPSGCVFYSAIENGDDFVITAFNEAAERLENVRSSEVVGKRVTEAFPGIKDFGLLSVLKNVWSTGYPEHFPMKHYKDNRISGWRDNHVFKIATGEVVAVYEDVTEQKMAEEALKHNLEELEKMNKLMVGRELKMVEMKAEILKLKDELAKLRG